MAKVVIFLVVHTVAAQTARAETQHLLAESGHLLPIINVVRMDVVPILVVASLVVAVVVQPHHVNAATAFAVHADHPAL